MQSTTSAKVQFNGQFRRFVLKSNSFDALAATIRSIYNISDALEVRVRYLDDEGDEITISSDAELVTALQTITGCLKLSVIALQKDISLPQVAKAVVPKPIDAPIIEKQDQQTMPVANGRNRMPDFVREIIKQKQANKKEKVAKPEKPFANNEKPTRSAHRARLVVTRDAPDCEEFAPDANFNKSWIIRNPSALPWSTEFKLIRVKNDSGAMSQADSVSITRAVAPNELYEVTVPMHAPSQPGTYENYWRMTDNEGKKFGPILTCKINVVAKPIEQPVVAQQAPSDAAVVVDRKQLILARKQAREERFKKYEGQLAKLQELGYKTNNQHVRLLAEFDGDVDRVVAFIAQKRAQAKS
jgi:hypothetical protein